MTPYYTYIWLGEDGSPRYVGKGRNRRAFKRHRIGNAPPIERIILQEFQDEASALMAEVFLIGFYGRRNSNSGPLLNLTDGGEGQSGTTQSAEVRNKISAALKGRPSNSKGKHWKEHRKMSDEHRAKISRAQMNHSVSDDTRKSISDSHKGKAKSALHRQRISEAIKRLYADKLTPA
jgi:hypothetical protein